MSDHHCHCLRRARQTREHDLSDLEESLVRQFHVDFGGNPALNGLGEVVRKLVSAALPTGAGREPRLHAQNGVHQTMGLLHLNTQTHRQHMVSVRTLIN